MRARKIGRKINTTKGQDCPRGRRTADHEGALVIAWVIIINHVNGVGPAFASTTPPLYPGYRDRTEHLPGETVVSSG